MSQGDKMNVNETLRAAYEAELAAANAVDWQGMQAQPTGCECATCLDWKAEQAPEAPEPELWRLRAMGGFGEWPDSLAQLNPQEAADAADAAQPKNPRGWAKGKGAHRKDTHLWNDPTGDAAIADMGGEVVLAPVLKLSNGLKLRAGTAIVTGNATVKVVVVGGAVTLLSHSKGAVKDSEGGRGW